MPTIKDVAREAGVSIATVSYVLNNKAASVSEPTRQVVLEAAQRIGYRPNVTARNLRSNQTRLIGYAWYNLPDVPQSQAGRVNSVVDWFTYYLAHAAQQVGYHLLTFTYPTDDPLPTLNELILTSRVDAFVLSSTQPDDARIRFLLEQQFPFVAFGRSNPDWMFPYVDTDGAAGMCAAVDYLISLGHRRIAAIGWDRHSLSGNFRLEGYFSAMQAAGLPIDSRLVCYGSQAAETGTAALESWLALPQDEQPTAVVAVSDLIAIGVIQAARAHGLCVGRDLSVIGFDDVPLTEFLNPALTTVRQPIPEIAQAIIAMLETLLSKRPLDAYTHLVAPHLIVRDSCAPPR